MSLALLTLVATSLVTPYARQQPLEIREVRLSSEKVACYERVEMTVDLSATYANPFDPDDVAVDARVTLPDGKTASVPGFLDRPYQRVLTNGQEKVTPSGDPAWRVRFTPALPGKYSAVIAVRDRTGRCESKPVRFTATPSRDPGFVRLSDRDRRYFAFDNGQAYFPIGENICWGHKRGTFDYDDWLPALGRVGGNYTRFWLSPCWFTFALERPGKPEQGLGMGQFDLANAWRLDYALDLARTNGIRVMVCIDSFNILRDQPMYDCWKDSPHNAAKGGPLLQPADFWQNAEMDRFYRNKLRYLVARYGADTAVLSWEFWNEVDCIGKSYATEPVKQWHARMARYLREIDPYRHLITTSYGRSDGDPAIDTLPELDYVQTHHYSSPDIVTTLARKQAEKIGYNKPHYVGEIGADSGGARFNDDPEGVQVHDPLWVTLATGGSGLAAPWYWELIHTSNLYGLFGAAVKFTADIDWPAEAVRPAAPQLEWQKRPDPLPRKDLELEIGSISWERDDYNRPHTVRITRDGAAGELPVAGIQHGLGGHRDKHNPVTFETDLPWPTRLLVEVGGVSGWGGAALRLEVDGQPVLAQEFPNTNPPDKHDTLNQCNRVYAADLPAGRHTARVENTGKDWFYSSFRFEKAVESLHPPLVAWAITGKSTAIAWVRVEGRSWRRVCALKEQIPAAPPSVLVLPGLAKGKWDVELWDTWGGKPIQTFRVKVPSSGEARVALPAIEKDLAVKLRRHN
ncbi:MAG TPA: DUF5060 domain-containing protein [Kiritimatiellia bacterium]|nr:DUF5060 domain-containing protein [Kiritimatiellia bacterium]HPS06060.1 DUF5060 domain-containing protein [Kiritimatiellia bacterium]